MPSVVGTCKCVPSGIAVGDPEVRVKGVDDSGVSFRHLDRAVTKSTGGIVHRRHENPLVDIRTIHLERLRIKGMMERSALSIVAWGPSTGLLVEFAKLRREEGMSIYDAAPAVSGRTCD